MSKRIGSAIKSMALYWRFAASTLLIIVVFLMLTIYLAAQMRGETSTEISGRAWVDFRVFYLDNDVFDENPIPQNLHFLMSFTDYLEVDANFSAWFDDNFHIYYEYTATEHLVIRYMATGDANMNPVVYEDRWVLSNASGSVHAHNINSASSSNGIGGSYTINPMPHIDTYLHFIYHQNRQMHEENIIARGVRGFSAELFVDFAFTISVPELDFRQTINHGYRLSLSTEVYSLLITGHPAFTETIPLPVINLPFTMSFFMVVFLSVVFALSVYCFYLGIKQLQADPNMYKQKALNLIKKYTNEIVIRDISLDLVKYEIFRVDAFEELLKLAINLNKHIICHHNDSHAEFAVIVEEYAYYFSIMYFESDEKDETEKEEEREVKTSF